jgi:hypothetical protein
MVNASNEEAKEEAITVTKFVMIMYFMSNINNLILSALLLLN